MFCIYLKLAFWIVYGKRNNIGNRDNHSVTCTLHIFCGDCLWLTKVNLKTENMRLKDKNITMPFTSAEHADSSSQNVKVLAEAFWEKMKKKKRKVKQTHRILRFLMPEKSTLVILVMLFRFKSLQRETRDGVSDWIFIWIQVVMHVKPNTGTIRKARALLLYRHRENSAHAGMSPHCCYELLSFIQQKKPKIRWKFFVLLLSFNLF